MSAGTTQAEPRVPETGPFGRGPTTALRRYAQPRNVIIGLSVAVVGYLAIVPLGYLFDRTLAGGSLDAFVRAYGADSQAGQMVVNSVLFAVGSTGVALVIGGVLAFFQVRTDAPLRGLLFAASLVPLIIPSLLYSIAWIFLSDSKIGVINTAIFHPLIGHSVFDIFSLPGMVWVQGLHNAPVAFLLLVGAFRGMDPSLEESALMSGARWRTVLRRVTVPLLRPAIVAAVLLVFVQSLESFEVPAVIGLQAGIYVFTSRIYFTASQFPIDYGVAGAYALGLLAMAVAGVLLSNWLVRGGRGYQTISGKAFRPRRVRLGRARPFVGAAIVCYFVVAVVAPVAMLLYGSLLPFYRPPSAAAAKAFTLATYSGVFHDATFVTALRNTAILGVGAATVVTVLTAISGYFVVRTRTRGRRLLDVLTFTPLVIPGIVLGLALAFVYLRIPLPIYGTLWILLVSYSTRFLPYGMRYSSAAMSQMSMELEESAYVHGASWWQTFRRVLLPLASSGVMAGWIYVLIVSFRELSSTILLYSPGRETLSILIFEKFSDGDFSAVAALGVLMVAILVVLAVLAFRLGTRLGVAEDAP